MHQGHFEKGGFEGSRALSSVSKSEPPPGRGSPLSPCRFGKRGLWDLSNFFCALLKIWRSSQLCFRERRSSQEDVLLT